MNRLTAQRAALRGHEVPCPGCARVVAYKYAHQYAPSRGPGKPRVAHKCEHGEPCIFGSKNIAAGGWNWPKCEACRRLRVDEYRARTAKP